MFATDFACHWPPRAVATPRAFKADAISLKVAAPAFCASRMMGSTLPANLSASVVTASSAPLRATESLGLPRVTPRAFAAARACRVRVEMRALLLGKRSKQVQDEGVYIGAKLRNQERHLVGHEAADEMHIAAEAVQFS